MQLIKLRAPIRLSIHVSAELFMSLLSYSCLRCNAMHDTPPATEKKLGCMSNNDRQTFSLASNHQFPNSELDLVSDVYRSELFNKIKSLQHVNCVANSFAYHQNNDKLVLWKCMHSSSRISISIKRGKKRNLGATWWSMVSMHLMYAQPLAPNTCLGSKRLSYLRGGVVFSFSSFLWFVPIFFVVTLHWTQTWTNCKAASIKMQHSLSKWASD